jgi:pyruvate/2-oxoglutarate dehydrogenase complex dihydrolipoamide dehydrogenase (E3) component
MLRRLSLSEHGAVELLVAVALIAAPFVLGFGPAGLLASMAAGALLAGLALAEDLPIGTHMAADTMLSAALLGTAVALAAGGETDAGGVLAAAGAGELALGMATRWTRRA